MKAAIDQFQLNLSYVKHLGALHKVLRTQTTEALDLSDILRAQIVMLVSALDQAIHQMVRIGMIETYQGNRPQSQAFLRFPIPFSAILKGFTPTDLSNLENEIILSHKHKSFQHPEKIAEALRLISEASLWQEIGKHLSMTAADAKAQLNLIVDRRNKIAHEADMDPTYPNTRWPIDEMLVNDAVDFIEQLISSIYKIMTTQTP